MNRDLDTKQRFDVKLDIIFENKDFLVINKPAGLAVHPVKSLTEKTLITLLSEYYPAIKNVGDISTSLTQINLRPGIVHRLDKDVSGLMIVAKNQRAFEYFKNEFSSSTSEQGDRIIKEYLALVHNQPPQEKGIINLPLVKKGAKTVLAKRVDLEKIKASWTEYQVIRHFVSTQMNTDNFSVSPSASRRISPRLLQRKPANTFTLLKVKILTGRTHQIRIHLKSIGCPIVGDPLYKIKRQKFINLNRIFLHAFHLAFKDLSNQKRDFKIGLPKELIRFIKNCEK